MSGENYSGVATDRLVALFVDAAKRFGLGRRQLGILQRLRNPTLPEPAEDPVARKAAATELWALSVALVERRAIAEVERMLEDDNPDIRATTAAFMGSLSPDLADAAGKAYRVMRPTREILALQRRARQAPPAKPTLDEMSDSELVARFEDAAMRESGTRFLDYLENDADKDLQNAVVVELCNVMRALKRRGLLARLLPFLASDNLTLRREAAVACLRIAEPEAIAALESVAHEGIYGDGFEARHALKAWREKGRVVHGV
jgi:hypothetical protein